MPSWTPKFVKLCPCFVSTDTDTILSFDLKNPFRFPLNCQFRQTNLSFVLYSCSCCIVDIIAFLFYCYPADKLMSLFMIITWFCVHVFQTTSPPLGLLFPLEFSKAIFFISNFKMSFHISIISSLFSLDVPLALLALIYIFLYLVHMQLSHVFICLPLFPTPPYQTLSSI